MKEPDNTCPIIDEAIRDLKKSKDHLEDVNLYVSNSEEKIDDALNVLEDIRAANEKLREWGSYWKEYAEEGADRIRELEKEIEELKCQAELLSCPAI